MRIGIDAKWYFEGPPSGRRVVRALVDALACMYNHHEFYLFLNRRHKHKSKELPETFHKLFVWAGNNQLSNLFVLPRLASTHGLDVVLYQNFAPLFGSTLKIAYIHDVLFLSHPAYYTLAERLYFAPLRFLTRHADGVITVSEEEKKRLIQYQYAAPDRIAVAHHGVDSNFKPKDKYETDLVEEIRRRYDLPDRFILFVGRLNLRKNLDNLLRAIPLLSDKSIPLVLVGSTNWKESNHERIIHELNLQDRVVFKGSITEDLGVVYSLATLFCFPSFAESFGLPPLEAMACGVPVVVSNTTSLPEVCGEAGTYVKPDDPSSIAAAIDSLLSNPQLYNLKRSQGLAQAAQFTWERAATTILKAMEEATQLKP